MEASSVSKRIRTVKLSVRKLEAKMSSILFDLQIPYSQRDELIQLNSKDQLIDQAISWILDGWELPEQRITLPMIAAALFNEANDQDEHVRLGESDISFSILLRETAYKILKIAGH